MVTSTYPQSIEEFCNIFPHFRPIYDYKVRHYILRDHTNLVLNQFDKYFSNRFNAKERELIRFFLIIHDIGKPRAFEEGDISIQHDHSIKIIKEFWFKISESQKDLNKVLLLLKGDYIGEYFQNKHDVAFLSGYILNGCKRLSTTPEKLLKLFLVYYQCDTAAYTQDAGGSKFLEHLFCYKDGIKIFDKEEGLFRFSCIYWHRYLKIKNEILRW
ncbi:hypothetical protein V5739_07090 [Salinimicrobium sp. TIG7-5_MAKvit]|uniref:hypothetical protein n=1 Tax=Salinimicrobium sp. TIG7-5_MAKvit TaxID=3121289 RepID=UPI003C6E430A